VLEAAKHMAPPPVKVYRPQPEHRSAYDILYTEYRKLYDYFGRGENRVMKVLKRMRKA
jgi:L-ribulokinase